MKGIVVAKWIWLFVAQIAWTPLAMAQESAEDSLEEERLEVQADSSKVSFFSRILNQQKPVTFLAVPIVSYTPETSLQLGVGALISMRLRNDSLTTPSYIAPWFTYSINKQIITEVFGSFFLDGKKHQLDYEIGYFKLQMPYFGRGNEVNFDDKEQYLHGSFRFWANYQYRFKDKFLIGPRYHIDYSTPLRYETDGLLETDRPAGYEGGLIHGMGLRLAFDTRDDLYFPYSGHYAAGTATYYPDFLGSDYNFGVLSGEYRSFINIKRKVILASQILGQISTGNTPFYMLPRLGGRNVLRGYLEGNYRDNFLFYLQGELRVPVDRFIFTGFFGSGIVGPEFKDYFNVQDYNYSIGAGVRFRPFPDSNIMARLDFGFWRGTYGFYFVFNEAF